jgi:hypothetical protein
MKDELIKIWKKGDDLMFRDKKTDKTMIMQYLNEKTLKGTRSINFNIVFYGAVQVANLVLLFMNLAGYMNNTVMIWILIPMLLFTIGSLVYGIDIFNRFREINNYSESLHLLITRQLRFFRSPYEWWLILSSISVVILTVNINLFIDNTNGTYAVNNKVLFYGIIFGLLLFIYGSLKITSLFSLRSVKAYLSDLEKGALDQSMQLEKSKKKLTWVYVSIMILLTASLILGILKAIR